MRKIGILARYPEDVFQSAVISSVQQIAAQSGYEVVIGAERDITAMAGILVIANAVSDTDLETIYRNGKPLSLVSHRVAGTIGAKIPVVTTNNAQGIGELVKHLVIRCGRRRLVFIRGLPNQRDNIEREAAFLQEAIRYDLRILDSHILRGDFSAAVAADSVWKLLKQRAKDPEPFDGIIASDYMMAIAAVEILRKAGIDVPQAVSVVGFGDDPVAEAAGLTTVAASINNLGACAARQLISQIEGMRISGTTTLSVQLVVRETCCGQTVTLR